jgi:predicted NUDIX family NTP pyrophosphohydrolase
MAKKSAGLLMYRVTDGSPEILLVHPGGPFWARKDAGAWSVPKGEYDDREDALQAAIREFEEETGLVPRGDFIPLRPVKQPSGKLVTVWAFAGDWDVALLRSNTFTMEWPPKSGQTAEFPEVDRASWFTIAESREKVTKGQRPIIDELILRAAWTLK